MRSESGQHGGAPLRGALSEWNACTVALRAGATPIAIAAGLLALTLSAVVTPAALGQSDASFPGDEELLLPETISEQDLILRGRYEREWKQDDGTWVLMFTGGFELTMGQKDMSATEAVVWLGTGFDAATGRRFADLTVYLSENAQVTEPNGTVVEDDVLLVSNLRTFGRVTKEHDAHGPEALDQSPLYQRALRDRQMIESGQYLPPEGAPADGTPQAGGVTRPGEIRRPRVERAPRVVRYSVTNIEPATTPAGDQVYVSRGRVYFSQAGGPEAPMLEIQADNAVIFPAGGAAASVLGAEGDLVEEPQPAPADVADGQPANPDRPPRAPEGTRRTRDGVTEIQALPLGASPAPAARRAPPPAQRESAPPVQESPAAEAGPDGVPAVGTGDIQGQIRGVYLEGDVVLSFGTRFIRANRLYYDFENDRALILDAVFRAEVPERGIPLYVRADEIRQLSAREYSAENALVTTSEFFSPHYHVGAEKVYIYDRTQRGVTGVASGQVAGTYDIQNATFNVEGFPLLYWPRSRGDFEGTETALRRFRTSYSGEFGATVETAWRLFNLLGVTPPPGWDSTLRLDYFADRGPAVGIDADYLQEDNFGLFRSYLISDDGEDKLGPLRRAENDPSTDTRGRVLWRHRHYLDNDWEATFEVAYISDPNFLETYEESEFNEGKEQETVVYLKRARDVDAVTFLANWRLLDFTTQTEHLPDLTYRRIGDALGPFVLYHESRIGAVRYRPDDRRFFDDRRLDNTGLTDVTFRTDVREEAELPLKVGSLNIVPFATLRGSFWDGAPHRAGGLWRGFATYGVRGGTTLSRIYDFQSELLDINGIRHIIKPQYLLWYSHSNARSDIITPFDEGIETIEDFYGAALALKQTWQTKRGAPGRETTVDLLEFNLEMAAFGDAQRGEYSNGYASMIRPEDSRSRNYVAGDLIYRLGDTTSLLYEFNVDMNDWSFDRHNLSIAVERLPRTAYVFGVRHAGDIDMNLIGGGFNYQLNEKHILTARAWYDIDRGDLGEVSTAIVRRLPRWYVALQFEYDEIDDDYSVTLSVWPEGVPEWTLGSRRFTGLSSTTGIRP